MSNTVNSPRVSVLLPVYNGGQYLRSALESIQNQTLRDFECIIVDDGSKDRTKEIAEKFSINDERFQVLSRPNTGIVGALNDGIKLCRAKYIARMDADDIAVASRLEKQTIYLDEHAQCVAVGSSVRMIDPDGDYIWTYPPPADHQSIIELLHKGNGGALVHPSLMARRDRLIEVGCYHARWQLVEDFDLYLRLSKIGKLSNLQEPLLDYRQHFKSANATQSDKQAKLIRERLAQEEIIRSTDQASDRSTDNSRLRWIELALMEHNYRLVCKQLRILLQQGISRTIITAIELLTTHLYERAARKIARLIR